MSELKKCGGNTHFFDSTGISCQCGAITRIKIEKPVSPPTDPLEKLIELFSNGRVKEDIDITRAIKLLAEGVRDVNARLDNNHFILREDWQTHESRLESLKERLSVKLLDNTLARVADLTGRVEKLEEMQININNLMLKYQGKIIKDNAEQTKVSPQSLNPLTKEEAEWGLDLLRVAEKHTFFINGKEPDYKIYESFKSKLKGYLK